MNKYDKISLDIIINKIMWYSYVTKTLDLKFL